MGFIDAFDNFLAHYRDYLEAHFTATFSDCYSGGKFGKFLKQRHGQYSMFPIV